MGTFIPQGENGSPLPTKRVPIGVINQSGNLVTPRSQDNGQLRVTAQEYIAAIAEGDINGHTPFLLNSDFTAVGINEQTIASDQYTEQLSEGNRSIVSSSAQDGPAGTGATHVLLLYVNNSGEHKSEIVTLNGLTTVDTSASDIRNINGLIGLRADNSFCAADGTISAYTAVSGGGSVFATITAGESQMRSGVFFIGGKTLFLTKTLISTNDKGYFILRGNYFANSNYSPFSTLFKKYINISLPIEGIPFPIKAKNATDGKVEFRCKPGNGDFWSVLAVGWLE